MLLGLVGGVLGCDPDVSVEDLWEVRAWRSGIVDVLVVIMNLLGHQGKLGESLVDQSVWGPWLCLALLVSKAGGCTLIIPWIIPLPLGQSQLPRGLQFWEMPHLVSLELESQRMFLSGGNEDVDSYLLPTCAVIKQ